MVAALLAGVGPSVVGGLLVVMVVAPLMKTTMVAALAAVQTTMGIRGQAV